MNDFLTGFIEGLAVKPLYVGSAADNELNGQMVAFFEGVTEGVVYGTAVFD